MSDARAPEDDKSIPDDAKLWRRIPSDQMTSDDAVPSGRRPVSGNFDEFEMSAVIVSECTGGLATLLKGHATYGVACFRVREIRALGWGVIRATDPDPDLPGHVYITGNTKNYNRKKRADLAKACRMIKYPDAPGP